MNALHWQALELRAPRDVLAIAAMLGVAQHEAPSALVRAPYTALQHAFGRNYATRNALVAFKLVQLPRFSGVLMQSMHTHVRYL